MRVITKNLWDTDADYIFVTGNSYVKKNNELVMGRGAALEAKKKWEGLPLFFGNSIMNSCGHLGKYGIIVCDMGGINIGLFQVKYGYLEDARLDLIEYSTKKLLSFITSIPGHSIAMNFPGIGNGHLQVRHVLPIISILPDSVQIYVQ